MRLIKRLIKKQWLSALLLVAFLILLNSSFFWKAIFPVYYQEQVEYAAERFKVDPLLVYTVIKIESDFKQNRSSHKGATGLMQLMPETAEWINQQSGLNQPTDRYRYDPELNILLGTWYLAFLLEKYDGELVKTLVAYNAGQGHVDRWLKSGLWDGQASSIDQVPFGETRHYVKRALFFYERYHTIYR